MLVEVSVTLEAGNGLSLTIADDGRGIPPDVKVSGLQNMRDRAEQLGGTCSITSTPGEGTTILWQVPVT